MRLLRRRSEWADLYIDVPTSTNIFANLPYDVLQYHLNPFLTASDRYNFNQVVEPPERISKRLPSDYAIKHYLRSVYTLHATIMVTIHFWIQRKPYLAVPHVHHLCEFLCHPMNSVLYQYVLGFKDTVRKDLHYLLTVDMIAYHSSATSVTIMEHMIAAIDGALSVAEHTTFIRHIGVKQFLPPL